MVHFRSPRPGTECYIINRFILGGAAVFLSIWVGIITLWFVGLLLFAAGIGLIYWGISEFLEFDTEPRWKYRLKEIPRYVKWHIPPIRPDLDFRRIIEKNPNISDSNVWYFFGKICLDENDFAGAISALKHALDLEPSFPIAWFALGKAYLSSQNPLAAKDALKNGLQIDMGNIEALADFAKALELLGEKEKARKVKEEVLKQDPLYFFKR